MTVEPKAKVDAERALLTVQRRVGAVGFFAIALHGVAGTIAGAAIADRENRDGAAIVFLVLCAVIGLLTHAGVRLILGRRLWSPAWVALALAPAFGALLWLT